MVKKVIKSLKELIEIPSFGKIDREHPMIHYLKNAFDDCSEFLEVIGENGNVNLLIGLNTPLKNISDSLLFSGHIDTVCASPGHQPFATLKKGKIIGLGASDMKAFIASIISIKDCLKTLKQPVIIALTSDEESDFYGIEALTKEMVRRNITPNFVIVGEPTASNFSVSSRGNTIFTSTMHGKSCHSSTPELGKNAIVLAMNMVSKMEKISLGNSSKASISVVSIHGGKAGNIIPDLCTMKFSVRTKDGDTLIKIKDQLNIEHQKLTDGDVKAELSEVFSIPPFENRGDEFIKKMAKISGTQIIEQNFSTEAGVIQRSFPEAKIVICGPGTPECIHKAGESISVINLQKYLNLLNNVIRYYAHNFPKKLVHPSNLKKNLPKNKVREE